MTEYKATPEQWKKVKEYLTENSFSACILELRSRIEQLEAQANPIGDSNKMVPPPVATGDNKKPAVINVVMDGHPPAPHEEWEDWFAEVFKTSTIKGVYLRAIAPGDFSFEEEEATPPPVATDEELANTWHKTTGGFLARRRAIYNLGVAHTQASSREVAEPAPVAGGLVARVIYAICGTNHAGIDWSPEARAAILEVARWMRDRGWVDMPDALEQEVGR